MLIKLYLILFSVLLLPTSSRAEAPRPEDQKIIDCSAAESSLLMLAKIVKLINENEPISVEAISEFARKQHATTVEKLDILFPNSPEHIALYWELTDDYTRDFKDFLITRETGNIFNLAPHVQSCRNNKN